MTRCPWLESKILETVRLQSWRQNLNSPSTKPSEAWSTRNFRAEGPTFSLLLVHVAVSSALTPTKDLTIDNIWVCRAILGGLHQKSMERSKRWKKMHEMSWNICTYWRLIDLIITDHFCGCPYVSRADKQNQTWTSKFGVHNANLQWTQALFNGSIMISCPQTNLKTCRMGASQLKLLYSNYVADRL